MHKASKKLWEIEEAYVEGYTIQNFIKGFLHRHTLKLDSITGDQLYVLNLYFLVVQGEITSKIVGEYEKAYSNKSYPQYYEGVESRLYRILMDSRYETYDSHKEEFTIEKFLNILKISKASDELLLPQFQSMIRFLIARYEHIYLS